MGKTHGDRDVVSDRAVVSVLVAVSTPILQLFAGVGEAHDPVGVQALRPELTFERPGEAVVGGFAGPREVQSDIVDIGSEIEILEEELTAVVDPDRPGIAGMVLRDLLQASVFVRQRLQTANLVGQQTTISLLPFEVGSSANPGLAAILCDQRAYSPCIRFNAFRAPVNFDAFMRFRSSPSQVN